jgi:hypothetical protein
MASHSKPMVDAAELLRFAGSARDDAPGLWLGSGAAVLGLTPVVNATDVALVFQGNAPRGPTLADPTRDVRAPGDTGARLFRFEPPPDVAALWAIAPAGLRQELETAQFKAVRAAVDYLEADAAQVRTVRGERLPAGLVAAAFQRVTPEGPRPGFHTEVALFNVGTFGDGGWTPNGLDFGRLVRHLPAAQALYRAELAHQLRTWIGVRPEPARGRDPSGSLRLAGMPPAVVREVFRAPLPPWELSREELHDHWRSVAVRHGLKDVSQLRKQPMSRASHEDAVEHCRETTRRLGERQNHFTRTEAVQQLAERCRAGELSADMIRGYVQNRIVGHAAQHTHSGGEGICKSREQLDRETRISETVRGRADEVRAVADRAELPRLLKGLDRELKRALIDVTVKPGGCLYVDRLPAAQRDQFLCRATVAWKKAGLRVVAVGAEKRSLTALYGRTGVIGSDTVTNVLRRYDKVTAPRPRRGDGLVGRILDAVHRPWFRATTGKEPPIVTTWGGFEAHPKAVLVVPDATRLGAGDASRLIELARVTGAKLVFLGDDRQMAPEPRYSVLPGFVAGGGVRSVGAPRPEMKPWALDLRLESFSRSNRLTVSPEPRQLVADWVARPDRVDTLLVTAQPSERNDLNRMAQAARRERGELGERSTQVGGERLREGDRVRVTRRSEALGLKAGQTATITRIDPDRAGGDILQLRTDDNRRRVVPLREFSHVRLGYAATLREAARSPAQRVCLHLSAQTPERLARIAREVPPLAPRPEQAQRQSVSKTQTQGQGHAR